MLERDIPVLSGIVVTHWRRRAENVCGRAPTQQPFDGGQSTALLPCRVARDCPPPSPEGVRPSGRRNRFPGAPYVHHGVHQPSMPTPAIT